MVNFYNKMVKYLIVFSCITLIASCAHLPSDFKKCKKSDPNFNNCLRDSVGEAITNLAQGNKALGIMPMEPLRVNIIEVGGKSGGNVDIYQKYTNIKLHGFSTSKVTDFKAELNNKCEIYMETDSPVIRLEGDFVLKGKVLVIPIDSDGQCNVTMYNLNTKHTIECERIQKKGNTYLNISNYDIRLQPESMIYDYANVIKGEEELSKNILKTINENGLEIFAEIKRDHELSYGYIFKQLASAIFSKIPENEIFLE